MPADDAKIYLKRTKSRLKRRVEKYREDCPKTFTFLEFLFGAFNLIIYFLDVYTDINLCIKFRNEEHQGWSTIIAIFISIPYCVAMGGIFYYWWSKDNEPFFRFFLVILFPISPLFFDLLMPFYKAMKNNLRKSLVTFMVQYEATRTLSENFLESVPQMFFQIFLLRHLKPILPYLRRSSIGYLKKIWKPQFLR